MSENHEDERDPRSPRATGRDTPGRGRCGSDAWAGAPTGRPAWRASHPHTRRDCRIGGGRLPDTAGTPMTGHPPRLPSPWHPERVPSALVAEPAAAGVVVAAAVNCWDGGRVLLPRTFSPPTFALSVVAVRPGWVLLTSLRVRISRGSGRIGSRNRLQLLPTACQGAFGEARRDVFVATGCWSVPTGARHAWILVAEAPSVVRLVEQHVRATVTPDAFPPAAQTTVLPP